MKRSTRPAESATTTFPLVLIALFPLLVLLPAAGASTVDVVTTADPTAGRHIADRARDYLGVPYVYAGASQSGVDCSGLVYRVYRDVMGQELPRGVSRLMQAGRAVGDSPSAGDLLFFDTTGGPSHVGISLGDGRFVHAASEGPRTGVIVSSLSEKYYHTRYLGARRYIDGIPAAVRIGLDDQSTIRAFDQALRPGMPVMFSVQSGLEHAAWVTLRFYRNGQFILSKRIRSTPGSSASEMWLVPGPGEWMLIVSEGEDSDRLRLRFSSAGR